MATGGGLSTRELYSDSEEVIFSAMRPTLLNGIDDVAGRNDLIDRALVITLPPVPSEKRRTEKELKGAFEAARPSILGAMLDAVSEAIRNIQTVDLQSLPRMADFAEWVVAAEPSLPWEKGGYLSAYEGNRAEAVETALDSDAVSASILNFMTNTDEWEGTSSELLPILSENTLDSTLHTRSWPKSARSLSSRLRRAATFLRGVGIEVEFSRESHSGRRLVAFRKSTESTVTTVTTVTTTPEIQAEQGFSPTVSGDGSDANRKAVTEAQNFASPPKPPSHGPSDDGDGGDAKKHQLSAVISEAGSEEDEEGVL